MRFLFSRRVELIAICCALLVTIFCAPAHAQKKPAKAKTPADDPPPGEIIELSTLQITDRADLPPPERWNYVKIPGFDVLSNASERETKRLLRDFEIYRLALNEAWPIKTAIRRPAALIFCARNSFEQFVHRSADTDKTNETGRASMTLIGPERAFIILDLGTPSLSLNGIDIDFDPALFGATYEVDYYRLLYREYVHYLLSQSENPPPPWYEEGVLQILMKMEVDPKGIKLGEIRSVGRQSSGGASKNAPGQTATALEGDGEDTEDTGEDAIPGMETIPDEDFNVALRRRRLLSFNEFFGVTRDSPLTRNPIGNNIWAKQCYAFVHYCLFGMGNKYKKPIETLVARSAKEPITEQIFQECFGKTYKKFLIELRGHIEFTAYQYKDFAVKGKDRIDAPPRELIPAPEGLSSRIKADALLVANNPHAAVPALQAAYARGERDPEFLATYGLVAKATNQDERARRLLSQAIAAKTARATAYPAYAALLLGEAAAKPAAEDHEHITPVQLSEILEPLFAARNFSPPLRETYELIAAAWLRCSAPPKPANFSVLTEGLTLFPRDAALVYDCAQLTVRMDNTNAAAALVAHGLRIAADDATREKFAKLKATLPADPAVQ